MKRIIVNVTDEQYEEIRKIAFGKRESMSSIVRGLLTTLEQATPIVKKLMAEKIKTTYEELKNDSAKLNLCPHGKPKNLCKECIFKKK
ncbi:MAG TPA: hypothetical protein VI935_05790 [Thermodesulfobacteriota bacterium]|nr:hypothetical protein [Thermodesulfobacteriota bacterium]